MQSRDNQCVGQAPLVTEVITEGRRRGDGGCKRPRVSQHRAAALLFGVENYRKLQGQGGSAFMTLALMRESSPLLLLCFKPFHIHSLSVPTGNIASVALTCLSGHRTEATGTSPAAAQNHPHVKGKQGLSRSSFLSQLHKYRD